MPPLLACMAGGSGGRAARLLDYIADGFPVDVVDSRVDCWYSFVLCVAGAMGNGAVWGLHRRIHNVGDAGRIVESNLEELVEP